MPDNSALKIHQIPTPNIGGVSIFIGVTLTLLISSFFVFSVNKETCWLIIGCLFVMTLGMADDLKSVNPLIRILGHFLISIVVISFGFRINAFSWSSVNIVTTSLLIVASVNSVNLLDGVDGLAAGTSAICSAAFVWLAVFQDNLFALILSLTLLGTILGFLPYNFHPARIFLGDGGSTLSGFLLAMLLISVSSQSASLSYFLAAITILGLPFMDPGYAVLRRIKRKRNIFMGDREHFYDKLIKKGFSQRKTALIGYFVSSLFAISGLRFRTFFD